MKSLIRLAILTSVAALLASCGSSDNATVVEQPDPPVPEQSISGQVAGVSGAAISVVDANGTTVDLSFGATTDENGNFTVTISEAAQRAGVLAPLTIRATGGTLICEWDEDGDDDCGAGIKFGDSYAAPAGFVLRSIVTALPSGSGTVSVNVNSLTELAVTIAGQISGAVLMAAEVEEADQIVLDLLQSLTGTDLAGVSLRTSDIVSLTEIQTAALTQANLVLSMYSGAIFGLVDADNPNLASVADVISWLSGGLTVVEGSLQGTGSFLQLISQTIQSAGGIVNAQLVAAGLAESEIANSIITTALANVDIYRLYGTAAVGAGAAPAIPDLQSVDGGVIKGALANGTITVVDATGRTIAIASGGSTDSNGAYNASFTVGETEAGITPPLTVTVSGDGATVVCDYDLAGDNDCLTSDGTYVSFGQSYALPADFTLSGLSSLVPDPDSSLTVNINPVTDLAARLAGRLAVGGNVTATEVTLGTRQALSLVKVVTGIDLNALDVDLRTAGVFDVSASQAALLTSTNAALSAFGAAILGQIDPDNPERDSIAEAILDIFDGVSFDADNRVTANAALLARISSTISISGQNIIEVLTGAGVAIPDTVTTLTDTAANNATLFTLAGDADLTVSGETNAATAVDDTISFIEKLAAIIDGLITTTGAESFGGTQLSATEAFADELRAIELATSWQATMAFKQLESAIVAAEAGLAAGASGSLSGEGVSGSITISADGNTSWITDASSSYTADGKTVTVAIGTGSRWEADTGASFNASDVTMTTWDGDEAAQWFTGGLWITFVSEGEDDLGLSSLTLDGSVTLVEAPGDAFGVELHFTNITGTSNVPSSGQDIDGNYVALFTFDSSDVPSLALGFNGTIGALTQNYSLGAAGSTVFGSVARDGNTDTETITDLTVDLTLTLDNETFQLVTTTCLNGLVENCIGVLTVGDQETGALDQDGTVWYSDGSIQSFPGLLDFRVGVP